MIERNRIDTLTERSPMFVSEWFSSARLDVLNQWPTSATSDAATGESALAPIAEKLATLTGAEVA